MKHLFRLPITHALFGCLAVGCLVLLTYGHTLQGPFVYDDLANIPLNRFVRMESLDLDQMYDVAFHSQTSSRPLAYLSFALNYYVHEYDVAGFHVVNIGIHLVSGLFVGLLALATYRIQLRTRVSSATQRTEKCVLWMSLFAGCIFIAHPVQTQAVTYLVQRMTSMAVMFYLAAMLCYIQGRTRSSGRWRWWLGSALCGILALSSKQIGATLPFAVLLYEWYFFQDLSRPWLKRCSKFLVAAVVVFLAIGAIYTYRNGFTLPGYAVRDFTVGERLLTQCRVVVFYLSLVIFPSPTRLNLLHHFSTSHSLFDPATTFLSLLLLIGLGALGVWSARRYRILSFAIAWWFLQLALESTVVPLEMAYEHRLYLPIVGVALLIPWALWRVSAGRSWAAVVAVAVIVLLTCGTHVRNRVWSDAVTLWTDVIKKSGNDDPRGYNNRGIAFMEMGKNELALRDHLAALKVAPNEPMQHYSVAKGYVGTGRYEEAVKSYTKAIAIKPDMIDGYAARGRAYYFLGKTDLALADFAKAIELDPRSIETLENRVDLYKSEGQYAEAIQDLDEILRLIPRHSQAYKARGIVHQATGNYVAAKDDFSRAVELEPRQYDARLHLGSLLARCPVEAVRDGERAVEVATVTCEMSDWKEPNALEVLAAAYAELGDFQQAVKWQSAALGVASPGTQADVRSRLAGYINGERSRLPSHAKATKSSD